MHVHTDMYAFDPDLSEDETNRRPAAGGQPASREEVNRVSGLFPAVSSARPGNVC